jgi:hypothetical protein
VLLVDRAEELADLLYWLEDARAARVPDLRVLVTGERGSGKSILARKAMEQVRIGHPADVGAVELEGRSLVYRTLLERLAQRLAASGRDLLLDSDPYHESLDLLETLGRHAQVSKRQVEGVSRRHGLSSKVEGDALLARLSSAFSWERTQSTGHEVTHVAQVTDSLLHDAITSVLTALAARGKTIVVLFDDLDQASTAADVGAVLDLVQRILALRPCLSLVHLRSEALVDNVRREIDQTLELKPLPPVEMIAMLERRLEIWAAAQREGEPKRQLDLALAREPLTRLAEVLNNPLVFLRWGNALMRAFGLPLPKDWATREQLLVASAAHPVGVDPGLLERLLEVVDRCALEPDRTWCRREDLLRGGRALDTPKGPGLSVEELEVLIERQEVLLPRNRFESPPLYRVDPILDLLRPSVRARLEPAR